MAHLSVVPDTRRRDDAAEQAEAEWVRRIAAGDREALASLYRRYHRRSRRFLARLTKRSDIVDETVNDVFWVVWQSADRFRGASRVSTWIMGIAYRCAQANLRRHAAVPWPAGMASDELAELDDPFAAHELGDWVGKALARLAPEQRAAIELAYGAGHSLEEIAEITACPLGTVKARVSRARIKLREVLCGLARPQGAAAGKTGNDDV
jgi:RNA polymerase sigma-70 factor (ECF subfamily)